MNAAVSWLKGKKPEPRYICLPPLPINLASPQNPKALWNTQLKALLWGIKDVTWPSKFLRQVLKPWGYPDGSVVKNLPANAGDVGLSPGPGRSPWRKKWQPTPVFLPEKNPMDRGAWQATQSMGSQRVGGNGAHMHILTPWPWLLQVN